MRCVFAVTTVFLLHLPSVSLAAVTINEVAWMGDAESANHEWIELFNDGTDVDVSGWALTDSMNLLIALEGVIPAGAYVVLERTSDDSAPGNAFLLYSGALVNTGATLTLKRLDGSIEDQVAGGENWQQIGGDNATKETAQYSQKGWITAAPTPGAVNATTETIVVADTQPVTKSSPKLMAPTPRPEKETQSEGKLTLDIAAPTQGYVNQPITFSVSPTGLGRTVLHSLVYDWNFGDLYTASTQQPTHVFSYPGTYLVTVKATYSTFTATDRHEITILPTQISLTQNSDGDVQINNDARYEIDVSRFVIQGTESLTVPAGTTLLPGQTITVPRERIGASVGSLVTLFDATKTLVASTLSRAQAAPHEQLFISSPKPVAMVPTPLPTQTTPTKQFGFASTSATDTTLVSMESATNTNRTVVPVGSSAPVWPYVALILLIGVATVAVILKPKADEMS